MGNTQIVVIVLIGFPASGSAIDVDGVWQPPFVERARFPEQPFSSSAAAFSDLDDEPTLVDASVPHLLAGVT